VHADLANERAVLAYTDNLRADVVLSSRLGGLPVELARVVRKQPGVAGASALVTSTGFFEQPGASAASVPLQGINAEGAAGATAFDLTGGTLAHLRGTTVALAASDARPGRRLGDTVRMRLGDGTVLSLKVVALFGAERGYESALLPARLLAPHTTNGLADQILVRATPGANQGRLRARLARLSRMYPGLRVADRTRATADYTSNQHLDGGGNAYVNEWNATCRSAQDCVGEAEASEDLGGAEDGDVGDARVAVDCEHLDRMRVSAACRVQLVGAQGELAVRA